MQFSTHIPSNQKFRSKPELIRFILHESLPSKRSKEIKSAESATEHDVNYIYYSNNELMKSNMFQHFNNMKLFFVAGA